MADEQIPQVTGFQNTGNPVLDSLVNIFAHRPSTPINKLSAIHAELLELAKKEPGGLRRWLDSMEAAD